MNVFQNINPSKMSRRDFIKASGAAAAIMALPGMEGCTMAKINNVPAIDYSADMLLKNCAVIDVIRGTVLPGMSLWIRNGIIQAVEPRDLPLKNALSIDLKGKYVIPGLIDAHCHPTITSCFSLDTIDLSSHLRLQKRQFSIAAEYGITTYRDVGSFPLTLHSMKQDIDEGKAIGPRVIYCNSMLNIKGGHPDIPPTDVNPLANLVALFTGMVMANFKSHDEMRSIIEKNAKGASLIKLTMDNKSVFCRRENIPVYSDDDLDFIFKHADKSGLPVSCHVHRKWGFDRALKYPINSLEHMVSDEELSDGDIERMAKKKVSIVPTMTVGLSYLMEEAYDEIPAPVRNDFIINELKIRKEYLENDAWNHCEQVIHRKNMAALADYRRLGLDNLWRKKKFLVNPELYFGMIHHGTKNLKKMKDAGITIGTGIDAGMPLSYFGGLYRELEFFSRAGFTGAEIARCATMESAKILGMADRIGSIEKGKYADLAVLGTNPLADVRAYRSPEIVMKGGTFIYSRSMLEFMRDRPVSTSSPGRFQRGY